MKSDVPLDYAVFQLSPRRSRCQLFVSYDGATEKLASGLMKPFIAHLKVAEEKIASAAKSIKLEVERDKEPEKWFTKGTLERFVRFVSTPEVLELVNTFDAEMSQLESARKIYSQGPSDGSGGDGATTASEATKKELLRAIDVRLLAVGQDLSAACNRASAAGFNPSTVSELQLFADQFGAHRLSQACGKFLSLFQKRPEFSSIWKSGIDDLGLRSSSGSDMSVDDLEIESKTGSVLNQHQSSHPDELRSDTRRPADKPSVTPPPHPSSRETSVEKEEISDKSKEKDDKLSATTDSKSSSTTSGPFKRQLSVQDRISLFENKQKENSPSTSVSKPAVSKSVELRKQPSDVSSAGSLGLEKAVLRRWSGASDVGIDPTKERKELDSGSSTPTSAATSTNPDTTSSVTEERGGKGSVDTATLSKLQSVDNGLKNQSDSKKGDSDSLPVKQKLRVGSSVASSQSVESAGRKDQMSGVVQSKASFGGAEDPGLKNEKTFLAFQGKIEQFASRVQMASQESAASFSSGEEWSSDEKDPDALNSPVDIETYHDTAEQLDVGLVSQHVPKSQLRTFKREAVDLASGSAPYPFTSPPVSSKSTEGETDKQHESTSVKVEDSSTRSIRLPRHVSPTVHAKKSKSRGDDGGPDSSLSGVAGGITADNLEPLSSVSPTLPEQAQRVRQSKGNQGLNSELKMKANELEKLFAEHKLRVPGDQSSATRRSKPVEVPAKEATSMQKLSSSKPSSTSSQLASKKMAPEPFHSGTTNKSNTSPVVQPLEAQDNETTPKQNVYSLRFSSEPKGKSYNKYMQKRDAKLKEEWSLRRPEKEARLKALHDSLERSSSEMKTKLAWSADRLDVARRAERLRSFNARSGSRKEQPIHSFLNDEDEDQAEYEQDGLDLSYRSTPNSRTIGTDATSSTSRASATPASRPLPKASASSGGRRKSQLPVAQSVPSFSDYKKENTKSSSGSSKGTGRPLVRNHSRSKSSCEDALSLKEEKPSQPHHSRKSPNPADQHDSPFPSSVSFGHEDELSRSMDAMPFSRKGNTYGISRSKATFSAVTLENEDEELVDTVRGVDYEYIAVEEHSKDITNPRGSEGSVRSANSGYENGDALGVSSQANPALLPEMPTALPSAFRSMVSVLDSPGESPGSWNSRVHNPFSFQHEASDFDASVDSPVGSPAYWNQPDLDAARMRKKWGAAQKPIIVADSSHGQPRKDLAKGLKRFLKFGRKNRGADNLADWVSVTTSEGDDDTEDGRDPANRSSDDLRKSRMGFPQYHPSDDGFSETDSFSEQGPKSFFSLSTFRSKGSDSKPR